MTEHYTHFKNVMISDDLFTMDNHHIADGTASLPSISFEHDTDTGIYRSAANELAIATGGTERLRVTNAGLVFAAGSDLTVAGELFLSDGTSAAPSLAFTNDANTGLYRIGADTLGVTANGAEVGRFGTTGLTLAAAMDLTVPGEILASNGAAATPSVTFTSDPNTGLYSAAADQIGVACNGANVATIAATGLTLAAGVDLTVAAEILAANGAAATPSITFTSDPNTGLYNAAADQIGISCNGANVATIASTGLTLAAGADLTVAAEILASNGAAATPSITFASDTNTGIYRSGADEVAVACNGAEVARFVTTGLSVTGAILVTGDVVTGTEIYVGAGTAGTPAYSFGGDPNTGMYNIGADTIGFAAGGAEVGRISATALQLAAGVDLIALAETIHASGTNAAPTITFFGDDNTGIYSPGADQVAVTTGGNQVFAAGNSGVTMAASRDIIIPTTGTIQNSGNYRIMDGDHGIVALNKFSSIAADTTVTWSLPEAANRLVVIDVSGATRTLTINVDESGTNTSVADGTIVSFTICATGGNGANDANVAAGTGGVTIPGTAIQITNPAAGTSNTRLCFLRKVGAGSFELY
jgi:hypothetical protein